MSLVYILMKKDMNITSIEEMEKYILFELKILGELLNEQVNVISMHRPSKLILENDIQIEECHQFLF